MRLRRVAGASGALILALGLAVPVISAGKPSPPTTAMDTPPETPATATPSPTETPSPVSSASAPPTLPAVTPSQPTPVQCLLSDLSSTVVSRKRTYAWASGDPGTPEPETVFLDITVTNNGPDCDWFRGIGQLYDNVKPDQSFRDACLRSGDRDCPNRYGQCVWFLEQEPTILRAGEVRRWTYAWDQRCGHPDARTRTGVAPGTFRMSLLACTEGCVCPPEVKARSPGCWAAYRDSTMTTASFELAAPPSPSPSVPLSTPGSAMLNRQG